MPALGGTDPADLVARARAELGFSRQLGQSRRITPPPRIGGSGGYPVWYREIQLERFHTGEATGNGGLPALHLSMGCASRAIPSDRQ